MKKDGLFEKFSRIAFDAADNGGNCISKEQDGFLRIVVSSVSQGVFYSSVVRKDTIFEQVDGFGMNMLTQNVSIDGADGVHVRLSDGTEKRDYIVWDWDAPAELVDIAEMFDDRCAWAALDALPENMVTR